MKKVGKINFVLTELVISKGVSSGFHFKAGPNHVVVFHVTWRQLIGAVPEKNCT